ncbi:MAG: hypothetical protein FWF25_01320 [Propionibacteriaceae bacterium]|nr:hypothetical protein [Propionibacteriaceae bacterium]
MCDTGGPRCTSSALLALNRAKARHDEAFRRFAAGEGSASSLEKAARRLEKAQADYDITKGGLEDLRQRRDACTDLEERRRLEERAAWAEAKRESLLAAHRAAYSSESWATPNVVEQISAVVKSQGADPRERALLDGVPVSSQDFSQGVNETVRWEMDTGEVGYFKPFSGIDQSTADVFGQDESFQPIHEAAAWQLAKRLGQPYTDLVPACVLREVKGEMGSFAEARPGVKQDDFRRSPHWEDAAFYDDLIGQQDRHAGNYLMDGDRLSLIDHGFTFGNAGDSVNRSEIQQARSALPSRDLTDSERALLTRLVASPSLLGIRRMLSKDRAGALRDRAERMLLLGHVTSSTELPY